ncbi:phage holin family protein [Bacillus cereus group sp. Bc222]|uniref:phage holin family protein n=1 Tax=Bacillus cereus group sp. Bc222 TaxID=3018111 RepID=UPI0022E225B9|nr:phage holin family protein [Bacillus cereus group sp. Bc222]MDA2241743.1 phage holin family protein [Bacillus cereus group sp. Bc222]
MEHIYTLIKILTVTLGSFLGYFFGGWDTILQILVVLTIVDYITGLIASGYKGNLKSKIGYKGIAKKVVMFLLVGVAAQVDTVLGSNNAIREATLFFFIGNELLSVLENSARIGIPLPNILTNSVEILKSKSNSKREGPK